MALPEHSYQLHESSNLGHDFNIDLNKTFDLNKCDEHLKASDGIKPVLEPFNKLTSDCTNQKKNVPRKLSGFESDESLGILPDLLNDEMTFDLFKTELGFSDNEIHDGFNPEINENPSPLVFSPPSDSQFNRISLFLKNVSTPLPNFVNDRRLSSTPKILPACQFVANTSNVEHNSSSHFLLDDKEPIIAGSCRIKFETDFNLDDLKNMKPLTSTYKAFPLPLESVVLNELNEETDVKSEVNFEERPESIENNLNVTQTFSNNVEDLFPSKHEDCNQNVNVLNNTFKIGSSVFMESADAVVSIKHSIPSTLEISEIRSNNCSEEMVKILDSTFAIPGNEINCDVDHGQTFVIDFNSTVGTDVSPKSIYANNMLNETHVLEMHSIEFSSKQQEQIANVTFIKKLENDTQISLENHFYSSQGMSFKPMMQILEEPFSENDLNEMQVRTKNVHQCINSKSQSASPEKFKPNVTFSEKITEILPEEKVIQNDNYLIESSNSPKVLRRILYEEVEDKICFQDQINLTENENGSASKIELSNSLQSDRDTFSEKIYERADQEIDKFHKKDSIENDGLIEQVSSKAFASGSFNEEMGGEKNYLYNQMNFSENENIPAIKMSHSDPLQSISDTSFSEKANERSDQSIEAKFLTRYSMPVKNPSELASFTLSKRSKRFTISSRSEEANFLESSVFKDSNDLNDKDTSNLQPISRMIEVNVFTEKPSEEIEICTHSVPTEDCSLEIVSKSSNTCVNTTFSEKTNQLRRATNSFSIDNEVHISQNSLEGMSNGIFSDKTGKVQVELCSFPTENDKFRLSLNSPKEVIKAPSSESSDKGIKVQQEIHLNKYNRDSVDETTSSNFTNLCLNDTLSKKAADKHNSPLKSCSLESKTILKNGLIKPTRIVYPRMVSEQRIGHIPTAKPLCKPATHKRPLASDFNRTLILSDNSIDKPFSKDLNRKFSLPCSSVSSDNKSKCTNDFKKPFEIPSKLGIKKPASNYQISRLDSKYSNGHLKNIASVNKQNLLFQPDLISNKNPKIVKSVAPVYGKGQPVSSRLSFHEKFPMKSFKMKERGLKTNTAVTDTAEKSANKISCPTVTDLPRKEKLTEIKINKAMIKNFSKHSIAKSLPRKCPTSLSNTPNKTCNSKPTVIKQKSAPAVNSCKLDSIKAPDGERLSKSVAKFKFSSLPKVQSPIKISTDGNESKGAVDKVQSSRNKKSMGFILKPYIPEGEATQFMKTQISTGCKKLKDNIRENKQLDSSIGSTTSKQVAQASNTLNVKKPKGQCSFLPMPKIIKDLKSVNLNDACAAQESVLQNQVCRRTSGKLPQLRRIPAPHYNK